MKRKFKLLLVLCTMFLLAGCSLKQDYNVDITSDKKVSIGYTIGMDDELIDLFLSQSTDSIDAEESEDEEGEEEEEKEITDEDRWNYLTESLIDENSKSGFSYEKYEKDNLKGYKFTSKKVSIDEVTKTEKVDRFYLDGGNNTSATDSQDVLEEILKSPLFILDGKTYKSNMAFKVSDQISGSEDYFDLLDMKLVVTLPTKATSNNATTVSEDGKTLTWDLSKIKDENIDFEFAFSNISLPIIIGGAVCVVVVICVIFFAIFRKKKTNTDAPAPVETTAFDSTTTPVAPVAEAPVVETPVVETPVAQAPAETPTVETPTDAVTAEQPTEETSSENNQGM